MRWFWCGSTKDVVGPVGGEDHEDQQAAVKDPSDKDTNTVFVQEDELVSTALSKNSPVVLLEENEESKQEEDPSLVVGHLALDQAQDPSQERTRARARDNKSPPSRSSSSRASPPARQSIELEALAELHPLHLNETKLTLTRRLRNGATSKVWLGFYDKKQVVVKKKSLKDHNKTRRFVTEILTLAKLSHPNLLRLVGCTWTHAGSELGAVTEYMQGGDLRSVLNSSTRLTWKRVKIRVAIDLAEALVYLHALQPRLQYMAQIMASKVLLNTRFKAKLNKLGLRRDYNFEESWKMSYEAVRWTAPEVLLGQESGEASDIYAFGVLMSELDTRQIPCVEGFSAIRCSNHQEAFMEQVTQGLLRPKFSWDCPPCIHLIAQECLQLDPVFRPSAERLVDALSVAQGQLGP